MQGGAKAHRTLDAFSKGEKLTVKLQEPAAFCWQDETKDACESSMKRLLDMGLNSATAQTVNCKLSLLSASQLNRIALEAAAVAQLQVPSMPDVISKVTPRLRKTSHQKLLVLDLDETLVHGGVDEQSADFVLSLPNGGKVGVAVRPHALACLRELSQTFEIAVFTAGQEVYASQVLDFLDPTYSLIQHRLYRDSCLEVGPFLVKDLRVFREFALKDVIMVDNSVFGYAFQKANGVPVNTWTGEREDTELLALAEYLKLLKSLSDVRPFNYSVFSPLYVN